MSTATVTMTPERARQFRAAWDYDARTLTRTGKAALADLYRTTLRRHGTESIYGAPVSKDELVSAILGLRYPLERCNEAIHATAHDGAWPGCPWCTGSAS